MGMYVADGVVSLLHWDLLEGTHRAEEEARVVAMSVCAVAQQELVHQKGQKGSLSWHLLTRHDSNASEDPL